MMNSGQSTYHYEMMVTMARNAFNSGKTRSIKYRVEQLKNFLRMIEEHYEDLQNAVVRDFNKNKWEVSFYELDILKNTLNKFINELKDLIKPDKLPFNFLVPTDTAYVSKIPYGVVLVLGVWNFPLTLSLHPLMCAMAAGNAVILKPSEISHNTSTLLGKLIPQYLDPECYPCVQADAEETKELLRYKFDYIHFVGSTSVGKYVMKAAAEHLTPVTLELGGKSPCYIDESADIDLAAKRIIWGKFLNLGQVCVSPDYVICTKKTEAEFVRAASFVMKDLYGREQDLQRNDNLGRIINEKHTLRLKRLLENTNGKIVYGGKVDLEDLWVQPTIVVNVPQDDVLMQEEIFGPILPIVTVSFLEQAVDFINSKPRPLCVYVFSQDDKISQRILESTTSGTACVNDVAWHSAWQGMPFGGIGESGMGYTGQGKIAMEGFCHKRSILKRALTPFSERFIEFRYPPYTKFKTNLLAIGYRHFLKFNINEKSVLTHWISFILGIFAIIFYQCFIQEP